MNIIAFVLLPLFLFFCTLEASTLTTNTNEIIATVNTQNIYQRDFNRLYNVQKRKFHDEFCFNLLLNLKNEPKIHLKRQNELTKAKEENFLVSPEELSTYWGLLTRKAGGLETLEKIASRSNLTTQEIKQKLEENLLLEKHFEKKIKEKLIDYLIEKQLVLEEALRNNIEIKEEEITNKLNEIIKKQGGSDTFALFLKQNNATLEDAKNEIRSQLLYDRTKMSIGKDFKSFVLNKKKDADIIVYTSKIYNQSSLESKEIAYEQSTTKVANTEESLDKIRTTPYPQVTELKVEEPNKPENELEVLESRVRLRESIPIEEEIITPLDTSFQNISPDTDAISSQKELNKLKLVSTKKPINLNEINEAVILEPTNKKMENKPVALRKKVKLIKLLKNKLKKKKVIVQGESLVPGELITTEEAKKDISESTKLSDLTAQEEIILIPVDESESEIEILESSTNITQPEKDFSTELRELISRIEQRKITRLKE